MSTNLTPETRLTHLRGTTLQLLGWVKRGGEDKTDLPSDRITLRIIDPDTGTPVITVTTGSPQLQQYSDGSYEIVIPAEQTTTLTRDRYRYRVDLEDAATGKTWCVARGDLNLITY